MVWKKLRWRSAWGILTIVLVVRAAQGVEIQDAVTAMLRDGWAEGDAGIKAAEPHFAQAKQIAPSEVRATYAWTLVYLHAKKIKEASLMLDLFVKDNADDLAARQTQIWAHAELGEHPQTVSGLSTLSIHLPKSEDSGQLKDSDRAAAKFMGRMFGYLLGPAAEKVNDEKLAAKEKVIADGLSAALRPAYDEGRREIEQKLAALRAAPADPAKPAAPANRAASAVFDANDPRIADLKAAFLAEEEALKKKWEALKTQYSQLAQKAAPLETQFQQHARNAQTKEADAAKEKNAAKANTLRGDAKKEAEAAAKAQQEFSKLSGDAGKLKAEAAQLERELAQRTQKYKADALKATSGAAATPTSPVTAPSKEAASRPLPEKLTALSLYVPLDLTAEKERILESFRK